MCKKKSMHTVALLLARKNRKPISVTSNTPVIDALKIMAEKNIGSIVVIDDGRYKGIVSERDYSRKVVLKGKSSGDTKVAEIMSTDLPFAKPADTIEHCMEIMSSQNIRYMPVFENETLTGIVSMSDVVHETILAQKETIEHLHSFIHS